mgnify:FL=1
MPNDSMSHFSKKELAMLLSATKNQCKTATVELLYCASCTLKDGKSFFNAALSALLLLFYSAIQQSKLQDPSSPFSSSFKAKTKPPNTMSGRRKEGRQFSYSLDEAASSSLVKPDFSASQLSVEKIKNAIFNFLLLVPFKEKWKHFSRV